MIKEEMKQQIIRRAAEIRKIILPPSIPTRMACLYHAIAMQKAVIEICPRLRAIIQAGSASWRVVSKEADDGVSPTHYSYVYEGWGLLNIGDSFILPEVHCWVAVLDQDGKGKSEAYIVDSTVKYIPQLAEDQGLKWSCPKPPDCLWAKEIPFPRTGFTSLSLRLVETSTY